MLKFCLLIIILTIKLELYDSIKFVKIDDDLEIGKVYEYSLRSNADVLHLKNISINIRVKNYRLLILRELFIFFFSFIRF